jgi:hypothetical protein
VTDVRNVAHRFRVPRLRRGRIEAQIDDQPSQLDFEGEEGPRSPEVADIELADASADVWPERAGVRVELLEQLAEQAALVPKVVIERVLLTLRRPRWSDWLLPRRSRVWPGRSGVWGNAGVKDPGEAAPQGIEGNCGLTKLAGDRVEKRLRWVRSQLSRSSR